MAISGGVAAMSTRKHKNDDEKQFRGSSNHRTNVERAGRQMRQWYFDLKEFKPEVGFEFEFVVEHDGNTYHHLCRVTEVISEKKIAYTWRYKNEPGDSLVTIELFAEGNKTRLKLTHSGIETFPKTPAYARKNFEAGWTQIIGSELKQFVEKTGKKKS